MRGSIQSFLRLVLQVTNGCLLVLGLVLGLSSLFLLLQFEKLQFEKERRDADPVSAPPPPVSPGTPAPPAPDIDHILATEPWCASLTPRPAFPPPNTVSGREKEQRRRV